MASNTPQDDPIPIDEAARLDSLLRYEILDSPAEQLFDDFTQLAAQICEVPISLISLVDETRQWFKSKVGLEVNETPRELAFCAHAIHKPNDVLVVRNALEDERFANNPLVTDDPNIRFYAGAPLISPDGYALGTLCAIDRQPRNPTAEQIAALRALARQVVAQMEARLNLQLLKESAEKLEQERREIQIILDHVPAFVFYKDTNNNILRINRAVAQSHGVACSDIEGKHSSEIYPEHADQYYQDDLEVIQKKVPKLGIIERIVTDNEPPRWIRTDKIPIANEAGDIERLLVVAFEITDLKETEESLRESQILLNQVNAQLEERVQEQTAELLTSQAQFEDLYQNAPDMHISVDPYSTHILQCNQTLVDELGYTREEILRQPVYQLYHPSSLKKAKAAMQEFRASGSVRNRELTLARKDGSAVEVSLNVSPILDAAGNIIASRSVWRDITEKKRLEEEGKNQAEQLAHLSRVATMNEMATGISHELNQPLHAIKNYAYGALLRLQKQAIESETLLSIFKDIAADADRAAELILSFRRFIKPSNRQVTSVEPRELIDRLLKFVAREMERYGSTVSVIGAEELPKITCDAVQINQVLINLLLNAAEANSESAESNGEIQLCLEPTEHQRVRFSISDSGSETGDVDVDRMFDTFYTTKPNGLGMGLPICRTIVEAHGGKLIAKENEGAGLTLSFDLPIAQV